MCASETLKPCCSNSTCRIRISKLFARAAANKASGSGAAVNARSTGATFIVSLPRLAAQLIQFEDRCLLGHRRLTGLAEHRDLCGFDDAQFQLRRDSGQIPLHQHLAQRMKAVGDFPGRRCFLLSREQAEGDGARPCGQRGFELGEAQFGQLYLLVGNGLSQRNTPWPFKCLPYRHRPGNALTGWTTACRPLVTDGGGEFRIGPRRRGSGFAFGSGNLSIVEIDFGIVLQDVRRPPPPVSSGSLERLFWRIRPGLSAPSAWKVVELRVSTATEIAQQSFSSTLDFIQLCHLRNASGEARVKYANSDTPSYIPPLRRRDVDRRQGWSPHRKANFSGRTQKGRRNLAVCREESGERSGEKGKGLGRRRVVSSENPGMERKGREERTGASTGKEPRTLSSASSEKTRERGEKRRKANLDRGSGEAWPGAPWFWWCSPWS